MVRFQRDRWYSTSGQQEIRARANRESTSPKFHLIKLVVLLLVVIVVMKQSADTKIYERFFGALTKPTNSNQAIDSPKQQPTPDSQEEQGSETANLSLDEIGKQQIWLHLFEGVAAEDIDAIGRKLFHIATVGITNSETTANSKTAKPVNPKTIELLRERLAGWKAEYAASGEEENANAKMLSEFESEWPAWQTWFSSSTPLAELKLSSQSVQTFSQAMDNLLLATLRDGSHWRSVEHAAFSRSLQLALQRASQPSDRLGPFIETLLLDTEIKAYRGQWIRFRGTVVRGPDENTSKSVEFGEVKYWVVWMRPLDMSNQPVCVYFATQPPARPKIEDNASPMADSDMILEVEARVTKRLAYAAQKGVEVAPVLFASKGKWFRDLESAGTVEPSRPSSPTIDVWTPPSRDLALSRALKLVLTNPVSSLTQTDIDALATQPSPAPNLSLLQILYQLKRQAQVIRQLSDTPEQVRLGLPLRTIRGWVEHAERIQLSQETEDWFGSPTLYRLTLKTFPTEALPEMDWIVFTSSIPSYWLTSDLTHQPIQASGLLLDASGELPSILASPSIDWSWDRQVDEKTFKPQVPPHWARFGNLGWNLSEIDLLEKRQSQPLNSDESSSFYSLLRIVPELNDPIGKAAPVIDTLSNPDNYVLRDMKISAKIIRVARIAVTDPAEAKRLGSDAYYQLDGMASLGRQRIEITGKPDTPKIQFEGEYPVTIVTCNLPQWLSSNTTNDNLDPFRSSESADVWYPQAMVDVDGVFYRLWGYTSQAIEKQGETARQFSPLIVARTIKPSKNETGSRIREQMNIVFFFIVLLVAGAMWLMYRLNRPRSKTQFTLPSLRDKKPDAS